MARGNRKRLGTPVRGRVDIVNEKKNTFFRVRMGGNAIFGLKVIDPAAGLVQMTKPGGKTSEVTIHQFRPGTPLRFSAGENNDQSDSTVQGIFRS